jgi:hypothetical protein
MNYAIANLSLYLALRYANMKNNARGGNSPYILTLTSELVKAQLSMAMAFGSGQDSIPYVCKDVMFEAH